MLVPVFGSLRNQSVDWGYKPTITCRTGTLAFAFNSALVPLVLLPLVVAGVFPHLLLTFAIPDPTLGIVAWVLLSRES